MVVLRNLCITLTNSYAAVGPHISLRYARLVRGFCYHAALEAKGVGNT